MRNKELILLKKNLDNLNIKVTFEKSGKNIIFYTFEHQNKITISLKGIFWKKDDWLTYKIVRVEQNISREEIKCLKDIKNTLLCKILDKGIKLFF